MRTCTLARNVRRCITAFALGWCAQNAGASDKPYQFGVFPYLPVTKIHELYGPMAKAFEAKLENAVQLSSKATYAAFEGELRRQTYDIAFVQPFDYVYAHDKYGYLPLARRSGNLEALIVVRQDSPLANIHDLKGRTIANPPMDAAVSHLTSMALLDAGIDPNSGVRRDYGKNHLTCLRSVLIGAADACGTAEQPYRTLEMQRKAAADLRVLHKTVRIPHSVFVVHSRVPRSHRDALVRTIVSWSTTEEGRRILERGDFAPFVLAKDADYEVVRRYLRNRK